MLWKPKASYSINSNMQKFLNHVALRYDLPRNDYRTVHGWSIENTEEFWAEIWDYCDVIYSTNYESVVDNPKKMPGASWFKGSRLNFAENLLKRNDDHVALIFRGEDTVKREITYKQLNEEVRRVAAGFKNMGVKIGDRIAAFMPNMPETIIAMLAATSMGAIWTSTSPDFGIKGVLDRFSQIEPKLIIAADGYFYKGKAFDSLEKLKGILSSLPSVEKVLLVDYTGNLNTTGMKNAVLWEELGKGSNDPLVFEQLPFDHPLYIMYSSGTTGLPKSIVHSAGGTLVQHLKELILHSGITKDQTVFYFTTCGWMMWNWIVSSLAIGSTLVLYDGNPFYPGPDALIKMAKELKIDFFGTSAKYIASLEDAGVIPSEIDSFPHLKVIASTGSPLSNDSFEYVYKKWKSDVQLSSIAGGTDIISCFILGNPVLPVYIGEIQCKGLGMDVDCYDHAGNGVINEQGELVCKTAFPSMPVYFWNDTGNKKYHAAYFEEYTGIWHHGDFIEITEHGGIKMLGRSDSTLNPQGVRIGTAEIYRVVESISEIEDSVVVGHKIDGDEEVVLFVKLKNGSNLDEELEKNLRSSIKNNCSPRHVPSIIIQVPDIPYTINGKKVEIAIKKIIHGQPIGNKDALANPECLEHFKGILN
ncbi:MAG: acetoacetate--CoA ligase [Bacteroidetes bacterium]|nr:acetoacetate--CoA ligase [Bacteroidota bacterium]